MKKQIFAIASVVVLAGVVTFSSCKKEDTTAPTISITGGSTMSQLLPSTAGNGSFTAPTATATDDEDGDLSTSVTNDAATVVDANTSGTYTVTYTVSDAAGNTATEQLTVTIYNEADNLTGTHNCKDTVFPVGTYFGDYNQTVTASTTVNGRILFSRFGDYTNNTTIFANVSGTNVSLPTQTTGAIGSNNHVHQFIGTGTVSGNNMIIDYTDTDQTASASASGRVHFIKQ